MLDYYQQNNKNVFYFYVNSQVMCLPVVQNATWKHDCSRTVFQTTGLNTQETHKIKKDSDNNEHNREIFLVFMGRFLIIWEALFKQ